MPVTKNFEEIFERILTVTHAKTQTELAKLLNIRQSSISSAKKAGSIPDGWYLKLFELYGINLKWLKEGNGFMYADVDGFSSGSEDKKSFPILENPLNTPISRPVYGIENNLKKQRKGTKLKSVEKISLPEKFALPNIKIFKIYDNSFAPIIKKGAYVGINISSKVPKNGHIFAVKIHSADILVRRLFFNADGTGFILKTFNDEFPVNFVSYNDYKKHLLGCVEWVLQEIDELPCVIYKSDNFYKTNG